MAAYTYLSLNKEASLKASQINHYKENKKLKKQKAQSLREAIAKGYLKINYGEENELQNNRRDDSKGKGN